MRLLIQSKTTGRFLVPTDSGDVEWISNLKQAGGGVLHDIETALQIIEDHADFEDLPHIIDLDRLGTENDYTA